MSDEEILERGGFSPEQIHSLMEVFALHGHSHEIEDVIGLEEELSELEDKVEGEEE